MTTTMHKRSVHIDAPVETVFEYVKDPQHMWVGFADEKKAPVMTDVAMTSEGVGSTYTWNTDVLFFHVHGVMTREESVANKRIVDRSSTGPVWSYDLEPDQSGTKLTLGYEYSTKVPMMDKALDSVLWKGDRDIDRMLDGYKKEIEG